MRFEWQHVICYFVNPTMTMFTLTIVEIDVKIKDAMKIG